MSELPPLTLPEATFALGQPSGLSGLSGLSGRARRAQRVQSARSSVMPPPYPTLKGFNGAVKSFHEMFPSLLSICKDIPMDVQVALTVSGSSLTERHMFLNRQQINVFNLEHTLQQSKNLFPTFCEGPTASRQGLERLTIWIRKEQRVRTMMRRLVALWLYKRYKDRMLNTVDPCTLEPCNNPVYIFDASRRGMYQFEASSLKRQVEFNLGFSDWLHPEPAIPKNPLTNLEFHPGQLLRVLSGIRRYEQGSWMLEAFYNEAFHLRRFELAFNQPLRLHAVNELAKQPKSEQMIDFLQEFIEDHYNENELNKPSVRIILQWACEHEMDEPYMMEWLKLWKEMNITKIRHGLRDNSNDLLNKYFVRSLHLLENAEKIAEFGERRLASLPVRNGRRVMPRLSLEAVLLEGQNPVIAQPTLLAGGLILPSQLHDAAEIIELTNLIANLVVHDQDT